MKTPCHTHEGGKACLACKLETLSEFVERYYRDICVDEARDGLARITAALAEREATGWISTSERMPCDVPASRDDYVLVMAPARGVDMAFWEPERGVWEWRSSGYALSSEVTHGQPLPAPPSPPTTIEEK